MVRWLEPEQAPALRVPERLPARIERRDADLLRRQHVPEITTEPLVAETAPHVVVAGDEPTLAPSVVKDAGMLAHAVQIGIRIQEEIGSAGVEVEQFRKLHVKKVARAHRAP